MAGLNNRELNLVGDLVKAQGLLSLRTRVPIRSRCQGWPSILVCILSNRLSSRLAHLRAEVAFIHSTAGCISLPYSFGTLHVFPHVST